MIKNRILERKKDGFYLKGEFMGESYTDALIKARKPFKDYSDAEKEKYKDYWAVIHDNYIQLKEITEKSRKTREANAFLRNVNKNKSQNLKIEYLKELFDKIQKLENQKIDFNLLNARLNKVEEFIKISESKNTLSDLFVVPTENNTKNKVNLSSIKENETDTFKKEIVLR